MGKAYKKNIFRTIIKSKGRYFAIMAIIALGVGFFAGLKVTKPGMIRTGNSYFKEYNMYDFRLLSTYGFDDNEVSMMERSENVIFAEAFYYEDFIYKDATGSEVVMKAISIPQKINQLELRAGRMPENADECVLDAYVFGEDMLGQTITIDDSNQDIVKDSFKYNTYTVVGMVNSPLYINMERGTTTIGDGRITGFVYIPNEGFQYDFYKEMYVICQDNYDIYTDEYEEFIENKTEYIKEEINNIAQIRYENLKEELIQQYQDVGQSLPGDIEISDMNTPGMEMPGVEIPDIEKPEIFVLDRSSNIGYMCYDNDTNIVDGVARVFPIFFFLIAALVCSTTMTRMIDDERGQIGTLRALGYSNVSIITKYMIYSGSSALIGCLTGFFVGAWLFPYVIWSAYKMLYDFGSGIEYYFSSVLLLICIIVSLACSMGTTYLACKNELRCMPAELVRPKAPMAGKRILIEKITFVWKKMKFLHKVTARNVFRFKKRMFMMLIGIAGCTALVLTGLGVRDSVVNLAEFQYDDIDIHDLEVTFSDEITDTMREEITGLYDDTVTESVELLKTSVEYHMDNSVKNIYLIAAEDNDLEDVVHFNLIEGDKKYPGYGEVMLSEKIADIAGISVGEEITLTDSEVGEITLVVSGIFENYVWHYAYVTPDTYEEYFEQQYKTNSLYINTNNDKASYELGASISSLDSVMNVMIVPEMKERVSNMMKMMNAVVWLVIGCAGALAFIVLFNLSNINITERVREIATIKVLGFYQRETGAYVFRENLVLTLMGIVVGLPLGIWLHRFVMNQIQVDMVAFKVAIMPISYIACVVIVLIFLTTVDLVMRRKIDNINMAESLKSIE